jgi:hypothetical protein
VTQLLLCPSSRTNVARQVFEAGAIACFTGEAKAGGLGRHLAIVKPANSTLFFHWRFFHSLIVMIGISLVKISIAFFLRRFLPGKKYQHFLTGTIVFLIAFTISCAGTLIFNCGTHVDANWNFGLRVTGEAKCFTDRTFTNIGIFNSSINIATDVLFAVLPIPVVWRLQANIRTKLTLCFVLSLGIFACIASIVKTVKQATALADPDWVFHDEFFMWNNIEFCIGILAASLPSLRPLFSKLLGATSRFTSSHSRGKSQYDRDGLAYGGKTKTDRRTSRKAPNEYYQFGSRQSVELADFHRGKSTTVTTITGGDDGSDKIILDEDFHAIDSHDQRAQPVAGAITKTTSVRVAAF